MTLPSPPSPRPRLTEEKLYQTCYDVCLQSLEQFNITSPPLTNTSREDNITPVKIAPPASWLTSSPKPTATKSSASSPLPVDSLSFTESQPHDTEPTALPESTASSTLPITFPLSMMNRAPLHGAPPRGRGRPPRGPGGLQGPLRTPDAPRGSSGASFGSQGANFGSQGTPSNLCIIPDTSALKIKLRKPAVKVKGAASPASSAVASPAPSTPAPSTGRETAITVKDGGFFDEKPISKPIERIITPTAPSPTSLKGERESALEGLFNRLSSTANPGSKSPSIASRPVLVGPDPLLFKFESRSPLIAPNSSPLATPIAETNKSIIKTEPVSPQVNEASGSPPKSSAETPNQVDIKKEEVKEAALDKVSIASMSKADIQNSFLEKACDWLFTLPSGGATLDQIKDVATKLHIYYKPGAQVKEDEVEKLKSCYIYAVYHHLSAQQCVTHINRATVKDMLDKSKGNFFGFIAVLVEKKLISIQTLDEVVALCNTIITTLASNEMDEKPVSKDAVDKVRVWPAQEKRGNGVGTRTCIIKGVSSIKSINELQALVWGGRVEYMSLPADGASNAMVRFLTPEACEKYYNATCNGIKLPGSKTLIFIEKQPGPNSVNDVIQACIDGNITRCIRAYEADEEWTDMALTKLARGKGQQKRELDRIKRGKTDRGRYYIEFRFSNILHALSMRRALMEDLDWEQCTVTHAPDPCDIAQGVHFKDTD